MKKYKINHFSTFNHIKCAFVERVNKTIKEKLYKLFTLRGNSKYIDKLQNIMDIYNNTVHSSIKMKPKDVKKEHENKIFSILYKNTKEFVKKPKYKLNQIVRISVYKRTFEKGYTARWSTELFKIIKISKLKPELYTLQDYNGNILKGTFYKEELQPVKHENGKFKIYFA